MSQTPDDELDRAIRETLEVAPSDDELLRYHAGALDAVERRRVEDRLMRCPPARERLAILEEALAEQAPAPLSRAARYVYALTHEALLFVRGASAPLELPAVAWATRGPAPGGADRWSELRHRFGGLDAHVRVEHVRRGGDPAVDVEVKIVDDGDRPPASGRVVLRVGSTTLDSVPTDATGAALFTGLAPACYELELRATGQLVGVMLLDLLTP